MGIWYTEKLYPGTSIGIVAATLKIKGDIDYNILEKTINLIIEKNDALRMRLTEVNGEPKQYLTEYKYIKLDIIDFSNTSLEKMYEWDMQQSQIPFQLLDSDLYYFVLYRVNEYEGGVFYRIHHCLSDAWSFTKIANDIMDLYAQLKSGVLTYTENKPTYLDYIQSELEYLQSGRYIKDKEYWNDEFSRVPDLTTLKVRNNNSDSIKAKRKNFVIPARLSLKIRQYCLETRTSIFSLFLSALSIYINRTTGRNDIVLGTPVLNRSNAKEKDTLGMFVNTIPIRICIDDDIDFTNFVQKLSTNWLSILRHQKYHYSLLIKDLREKIKSFDKLFDISISYQNAKLIKGSKSNYYEGRWHFNGCQNYSLCMHINDREDDGNLIINYDYLPDIFQAKEIDFLHDHIIRLLWHALDNPSKKISNIDMISEREKNVILHDFNNTKLEFSHKTIQQLFERQCEKSPDDVALVFKNKNMTYRELNEKANQLAWVLKGHGIKRNSIVGIMLNRSFDLFIGIIAVIKSGGVYVPIDPENPADRIKYILEDSGVKLLLTQDEYKGYIDHPIDFIYLKEDLYSKYSKSNTECINKPDDLLYIIYTSGTTGKPKGVMIPHRAVHNFIVGASNKINYKNKTVISQTTVCFDVFVLESLLPLTTGLKVVIADESEVKIPDLLKQLIIKENVNVIHTTPGKLKALLNSEAYLDSFTKLTDIITGGEPLIGELLKKIKEHTNARIYNVYGPTETTVFSTFKDMTDCSDVTIGTPIANTRIYILDKFNNIMPIGIPGELYIGGEGLTKGYVNMNETSNGKFVYLPFDKTERVYKTGDLARWYPKGEIEFLGRIDNQVKIRGFRIELEEIENAISTFEGIKNVSVIDWENSEEIKNLCAYVVLDKEISFSDLRKYLLKSLPKYMVPSYYVKIDEIPLTNNGKVDRNRLTLPTTNISLDSEYVKPRNGVDEALVKCWLKVLQSECLGIDDNFFEIGGDSLSIINVQTRIFSYGWNLTTQDLYKYPTIRQLSDYICSLDKGMGSGKGSSFGYDLPEITVKADSSRDFSRNSRKSFFVTGVTGFLGAHILYELYQKTDLDIYCLIRAENDMLARKKLADILDFYFHSKIAMNDLYDRVHIVAGDITIAMFGLDRKSYDRLAKSTDVIIHAAALVKHYGKYDYFKEINIQGTEEVIKFAKLAGCDLYHISTSTLTSLTDNESVNVENVRSLLQDNVYIKSKLKAERIVINEINNGLNAGIIRVGNLTGRYSDGAFQKNISENAFYNKLKSIIELGIIPDNMLKTEVEFTPVDLCSQAIVGLIAEGNGLYGITNVYNNNYLSIDKLIDVFRKLGLTIEVYDRIRFNEYIVNQLNSKEVSHKLSGIINEINSDYRSEFLLPPGDKYNLDGHISRNQDRWPLIDSKYIKKIIDYMKKTKYLNVEDRERINHYA